MFRPNETAPSEPCGASRRRFVQLAGAGLATVLGSSVARGAEQKDQLPRVLKRGDKIDVDGKGREIIEKAYELGFQYEKQHGG